LVSLSMAFMPRKSFNNPLSNFPLSKAKMAVNKGAWPNLRPEICQKDCFMLQKEQVMCGIIVSLNKSTISHSTSNSDTETEGMLTRTCSFFICYLV
jgi:hypothetical protein